MKISRFFCDLFPAYQSEIDDLAFDSEGNNVLQKRLAEKRKELGFLLQMMEISPEMVAVVFHQGFQFKSASAMEKLIGCESDEFPLWDSFSAAITLTPRAQELAKAVLKEPKGAWFLTLAAALEYMHSRPGAAPAVDRSDDEEDGDEDDSNDMDEFDVEEEKDARAREDAGADWMVEQGFDRKERKD